MAQVVQAIQPFTDVYTVQGLLDAVQDCYRQRPATPLRWCEPEHRGMKCDCRYSPDMVLRDIVDALRPQNRRHLVEDIISHHQDVSVDAIVVDTAGQALHELIFQVGLALLMETQVYLDHLAEG